MLRLQRCDVLQAELNSSATTIYIDGVNGAKHGGTYIIRPLWVCGSRNARCSDKHIVMRPNVTLVAKRGE